MSLPIRVRLTLWYAALLTATIVALSTFLVLQLRSDLRQALEQDASSSTVELARAIADDGQESDSDEADAENEAGEPEQPIPSVGVEEFEDFEEDARAILAPSGAAAQLLDTDGQVLQRSGAIAEGAPLAPADIAREALTDSPLTFTTTRGEAQQQYLIRVTMIQGPDGPLLLALAESLRPVEEALDRVVLLLLIAVPAAVVVTALAAYWLARKAMRPVERMTQDAKEIGIDRLDERVAVPATADETRDLAVTLNAMLQRIEVGVAEKHQLIADASHELRTPLAVMRTELDVSLRNDKLSGSAREVLCSAREEVGRMTRIVDNLLTLAQADEGRLELLTVPTCVRTVAEEAVASLSAMADTKSVRMVVQGPSSEALADPQRLRLAVTNMLENAIDFSPPGGEVRVRCWQSGGEVGVTVSDEGPGVSAEDRGRVFDRFFHVDSPHGRTIGGSGLGLAICRELAHAHGGRVWVDSGVGGGGSFSLALPTWRTSPPVESNADGTALSPT
jgi:heavy metal sensor kinase